MITPHGRVRYANPAVEKVLGQRWRVGSIVDLLNGLIGAAMLLLPVAGITLTYLLICRRTGTTLALKSTRVDATLAARPGTKTPTPTR